MTASVPQRSPRRRRLRRGLGEDAAASLSDNATYALTRRRVPAGRGRRALHVIRVAGSLFVALYLFVLALQLLSTAAGGVADLLARVSADGPLNLIGFGWLLSYASLSGSPVAALSLSLLDGGALTATEALGMIAGSRVGASLVVLIVGFVAYLSGRRRPDGIYVGVVALLTTVTVYAPATLLALVLLRAGALQGVGVPARWGTAATAAAAPVMDQLDGRVAGIVLFALGLGALLAAFWLFDRMLPTLDPPTPRVEAWSRRFRSPRAMFLFGFLLTSVTMSASISLTVLVPLTLKGVVRRRSIVPYVLGANITTFVDTLFAAALVSSADAVPVVLAQVAAVSAVSAGLLLAAYGPYSRFVLGVSEAIVVNRRWLTGLLFAMGALPLLLLAL